LKPLSLYIHIPFCKKKCYYCDFNSYSGQNEYIPDYISALKKEMAFYEQEARDYEFSSVFIGGGTPSLLDGTQVWDLMNYLKKIFYLAPDAEISIEGNPGLVDKDKLEKYYESGINRLSMGLQACQNHLLTSLGRIHLYEDFLKNLEQARTTGFSNINADLMFALPQQKELDWEECLKEMIKLEIPHISTYSLIFEEGTLLYHQLQDKKVKPLEEEIELKMYHHAIEFLKQQGYIHYEISNFAKPGYACKHNIGYWKNQNYLGIGAGAHSYLNNIRFNNFNEIKQYITHIQVEGKPVENSISLTQKEEISETMFLGLRMMEGISVKKFHKRFNQTPFEVYGEILVKLNQQKLIDYDTNTIWLTDKGIDLANLVFEKMLLD
jgi:oxygen-independent coproporphyrinogen III oxidase